MSSMSLRRLLPLAAVVAPAIAHGQIAEAVPPPAEPPSLAVLLQASADRPEFAAQRAETRLQNAAEVVRGLGAAVTRVDTTALGVTRLPESNGVGAYPPPPYVARYVLRLRLASAADVVTVSTALSRAGAASVLVTERRADR